MSEGEADLSLTSPDESRRVEAENGRTNGMGSRTDFMEVSAPGGDALSPGTSTDTTTVSSSTRPPLSCVHACTNPSDMEPRGRNLASSDKLS